MPTRAIVSVILLAACATEPNQPPNPPDPPQDDPRQQDRDMSVFPNLDFEAVSAAGVPNDWICQCNGQPATCKTTTDRPSHGTRALLLDPSCYAFQMLANFDRTHAMRFDLFAADGPVHPLDVMGWTAGEKMFVDGFDDSSPDWRAVKSVGVVRTAGAMNLAIVITNPTSRQMRYDDVIAVQDAQNPVPRTGSITNAEHFEIISIASGASPTSVYTPLPIDYATQVPLYVELDVQPPAALDHVEYRAEAEHDWGAVVHFAPAFSGDVTLTWRAVVMAHDVATDADRAAAYAAIGAPDQWLAATPLADASYAGIQSTAASVVAPAGDPVAKVKATVGFTSQWITNATTLVGLDATTVYQTRDASCTGYANLAVALGRAAGLPARHVVNIMVGEAQDMHSVTELYLGQALGWRRVEPQSTATTLAEDYGVIMRLVLPSDETAASLVTRDWAFGGVPLHELTEPVDGGARLEPKFQTHYDGCPNCSNRADPRGWLRDDAAQVASTFARARQTWQSDLAAYVGGGIDPARMIARRAFLDARTLADVDHILGGL